jgi:hypothetical protein
MKPDLDQLLQRWHDGELPPAEAEELTRALDDPAARARLRETWFLESSLPEALRAAPVRQTVPGGNDLAEWLLRLWAQVALRAVASAAVLVLSLMLLKPRRDQATDQPEPAYIAQLILQNQLD